MTIEKTIQKAIEGGWQTINCSNCLNPWIGHKQTRIGNRYCQRLPDMDRAMLDPLFWQSLGKAMGWEEISSKEDHYNEAMERWEKINVVNGLAWKGQWHSFIDHLADNKPIEEFFNQF